MAQCLLSSSAEELLGIFADPTNTTDSPDLGPPPVAHFDDGDPIKFDPTQELSPREGLAESTEEAQPKLSANLETRKKRRESSHRGDVGTKNTNVDPDRYTASTAAALPAGQPLKSGAKRKLNARDDDNQPTMVNEPREQSFQVNSEPRMEDGLTQPIPSGAIKAAGQKAPENAVPSNSSKNGKEKPSGASATITTTARKALGPSKCCRRSHTRETLTMLQKA